MKNLTVGGLSKRDTQKPLYTSSSPCVHIVLSSLTKETKHTSLFNMNILVIGNLITKFSILPEFDLFLYLSKYVDKYKIFA